MAARATDFRESWRSNTLSPNKWLNWGVSQCTVSNQQLHVATDLTASYYGIDCRDDLDLTSSYVSAEIVGVGNQALTHFECVPIQIGDVTLDAIWFLVSNGDIGVYKSISASTTQIGSSATFNSVSHRFVRIRESGGTTYFETSPDFNLWTVFTSTANVIIMTRTLLSIIAGCWGAEATATQMDIGLINMLPANQSLVKPLKPRIFAPGNAK